MALLAGIGFISINVYYYFNPEIELKYGGVECNNYAPFLVTNEQSIFGISQYKKECLSRYNKEYLTAFKAFKLAHEWKTLIIKTEIKDGKTIFTHTGTYLENGETKEVKETVVLDFVLTKNIPE